VIALTFHIILGGNDSRSARECLAYWAGFFSKTGSDLSYRTEFSRARVYAVFMALVASAVLAQTPALIVLDAWVRQVPGSDVAAAYLTLRNPTAKPITVMSIESSVAEHVMIHETKTVGGQSQMRPHEQLVIAPGGTVKFEPGGLRDVDGSETVCCCWEEHPARVGARRRHQGAGRGCRTAAVRTMMRRPQASDG
jgi:hypothetical protein